MPSDIQTDDGTARKMFSNIETIQPSFTAHMLSITQSKSGPNSSPQSVVCTVPSCFPWAHMRFCPLHMLLLMQGCENWKGCDPADTIYLLCEATSKQDDALSVAVTINFHFVKSYSKPNLNIFSWCSPCTIWLGNLGTADSDFYKTQKLY